MISSAATKVLRHIAPARADESYANTMRQIREDAQTLSGEAPASREELELKCGQLERRLQRLIQTL